MRKLLKIGKKSYYGRILGKIYYKHCTSSDTLFLSRLFHFKVCNCLIYFELWITSICFYFLMYSHLLGSCYGSMDSCFVKKPIFLRITCLGHMNFDQISLNSTKSKEIKMKACNGFKQ